MIHCAVHSQEERRYDRLYESYKSMPNDKLTTLGDSYFDRNILDSAFICYTVICSKIDESSSIQEKKKQAHAFNRLGNIHYIKYNYVKAQDMYLRSLEICEECKYDEYLPKIYNNIGSIYASFNDLEKAKSYYEKALSKGLEINDKKMALLVLDNLSGIHCSLLNEYQKALYYLNMSDSISHGKAKGFTWYLVHGTLALGNGNPQTALNHYRKCLYLAKSQQLSPQFLCSALNNISQVLSDLHKNDSAIYYLRQSEKIASENGLLNMQSYAYKELANISNKIKDRKQYFHYNDLYRHIEDSIRNMRSYQNIKDVEFLFEMNQIDKQVSAMKTEQQLKDAQLSQQRSTLIIISIVLLLIAFFLYTTYKQKKKLQYSYKDIFNKNIEIIASEQQAKQRYLKYEQELRDKNEYIARIENSREAEKTESYDNQQNTISKYQSTSLNEEQRAALVEAINNIMENTSEFCNTEFTLERLAELIGSKTKYVSQVINETYGKNFNRYVNEYRIKEARTRLTNVAEYGQYTVKAISQSVGFKSSSNFNLLFKEITGITPSMYQNMILDADQSILPILPKS